MEQNFRFALNGFNRSDVVNYLEFLNTKHNEKVNQLTLDNEMLRQQLSAMQGTSVSAPELEELRSRLEAVTQERDALMGRVVTLESKLNAQVDSAAVTSPAAENSPFATSHVGPMEELEAYRRAERTEREAKERAQVIRTRTEAIVQEACTKAESAAAGYDDIARQASTQLSALLSSVDGGRRAMLSAVEQLRNIKMD